MDPSKISQFVLQTPVCKNVLIKKRNENQSNQYIINLEMQESLKMPKPSFDEGQMIQWPTQGSKPKTKD